MVSTATRDLSGICKLLPKHLKLITTPHTPLLPDLNRRDSQNPPYPCEDVGKG